MRLSPILLLHICAGILGFLSGAVAVSFRKGSRRHALAGNVFVISMLSLSASGAYMAFIKSQPGNFLGGSLTFYLVATAWMTARRRDGEPGIFEWGALVVASALAAVTMTCGLAAAMSQTGLMYGVSAWEYFFLGLVALLAAIGDVRMLARGGISGAQRVARHLWRMSYAWFIAAGSIFLARQHLFPAVLRKTGVLLLLSFLPLILMIFWLVRVLFAKGYTRTAPAYLTHDQQRIKESPGPGRRRVALTLVVAGVAGVFSVALAVWLPDKSIADTLSATIASGGIDQAAKQYRELKAAAPAAYNFAEYELNALGYQLIRAKKFEEAIRIFQLNVEAYPQSSNVYDSLGEAYMDRGDTAQAIANFHKSLQLNPKNRNALQMLQKLNAP
jgi:hypothetical protein